MDRRRQRGERTRAALVAAALDRFEAVGFDATTVDEIASAAGVAPRTFFHHFGTKETVLFSGYATRLDDATRRFRAHDPGRPLSEALEAAAAAIVDAITAQPDLFVRRSRLQAVTPVLRATMLRINEEWIDGLALEIAHRFDLAPDNPGARLVAAMSNSAMRTAIDLWARSDGRHDLAGDVDHTFSVIRPAIEEFERQIQRSAADV